MQSLIIRQENQADYEAVYHINKLAFQREEEAQLVDKLRNSGAFIPELSLVALLDGQPAGYILFTAVQLDNVAAQHIKVIGLAPVAVLPSEQNKGIGGALIRKGLEIATRLGYEAAIVLGHENYYPVFGFEPAEKWGVKLSIDVPSPNFMALELKPGALRNAAGIARYAPEFGII
ncbi:GNAT family N-acetyltransferase [Chitinophaga solisilvae]|uniref:GNAT family N-acetyltransferase n=1 Tax=Chitinophaga solisilvae TaxID=1233460 RepID=UPI00136D6E66|nr:N-acetyltransferase [Chitinophaga solisilvae]